MAAAVASARRLTPLVEERPIRQRDANLKVALKPSASTPLGLRLKIHLESDTLQVADVAPDSLVGEWNASHGPEERVSAGLWIVSVNGKRGTASNMFRAMNCFGHLDLVLSSSPPPATKALASTDEACHGRYDESHRFPVSVQSVGNEGAGIEASCVDGVLRIQRISDTGGAQAWNSSHPEEQIRVRDQIVFVNGECSCVEMLASLRRDTAWRMVIRRGSRVVRNEVLPECVADALPTAPRGETGERCECGICLASVVEPRDSVQLPCRHVFHRDCVAQWLTKQSALCPFCRWAADHPAGPDRCVHALKAEVFDDDEIDEETPIDAATLRLPAFRQASLRTAVAKRVEPF